MEKAYRLAALAVLERLRRNGELERLQGVPRRHVSVLRGEYDHVQEILKLVHVPYRMDPAPNQIAESRIVFANCSGSIRSQYEQPLKWFAWMGGTLLSTDWCLKSIVERCFPNTIRCKDGRRTGDEVIGIEAANESLWADVCVPGCEPQWWLEGSSYPIEVLDDAAVRVEAASHELLVRYDAPVVAASFAWGKGRVHHVLSHFWMRRSRTAEKPKYRTACTEFLKTAMDFSQAECQDILRQAKLVDTDVNFAQLQTAVTSTELVVKSVLEKADSKPSLISRAVNALTALTN